jgi:YD repeat-containing protein
MFKVIRLLFILFVLCASELGAERVTNRWTPEKGNAAFIYDRAGNLRTNATAARTNVFTYDALDRLETATAPGFGTTTFTYNQVSQILTEDGPWARTRLPTLMTKGCGTR